MRDVLVTALVIIGSGFAGAGLLQLLLGIFSDADFIPPGTLFLVTGLALLTISYFLSH